VTSDQKSEALFAGFEANPMNQAIQQQRIRQLQLNGFHRSSLCSPLSNKASMALTGIGRADRWR